MPVYHKALIDHILEASPGIRNYEVDSVYFGGGTPSYYGAERLLELFDILKLNGNVRTDAEVTVECNPDSMDYKELLALREEGVNRLSVGVQAADDSLLKLLSRRHSWAQAQAAYHDARRAGFDNISVDLMYGLPTQTARDWADTLARVCELHPEHISCYALKLEEGTPMYEEYLNSPVLPDDDAQADMYLYAVDFLAENGYGQYEISNFARPGFASRHNLRYWQLAEYAGFGPGAHSDFGGVRYAFSRDLDGYIAGKRTLSEETRITPAERAREAVMLGLRTAEGISPSLLETRYGVPFAPLEKLFQTYARHGLAAPAHSGWRLTPRGFLVSNAIIGQVLQAMDTSALTQEE